MKRTSLIGVDFYEIASAHREVRIRRYFAWIDVRHVNATELVLKGEVIGGSMNVRIELEGVSCSSSAGSE
jgi:hypothetical protein